SKSIAFLIRVCIRLVSVKLLDELPDIIQLILFAVVLVVFKSRSRLDMSELILLILFSTDVISRSAVDTRLVKFDKFVCKDDTLFCKEDIFPFAPFSPLFKLLKLFDVAV